MSLLPQLCSGRISHFIRHGWQSSNCLYRVTCMTRRGRALRTCQESLKSCSDWRDRGLSKEHTSPSGSRWVSHFISHLFLIPPVTLFNAWQGPSMCNPSMQTHIIHWKKDKKKMPRKGRILQVSTRSHWLSRLFSFTADPEITGNPGRQ